jgi:rhodanese-related sulfurtransferase
MQTIIARRLDAMRQENDHLLIVNVLAPEVFASEHIPGSHNIPLDDHDLVEQFTALAGGKDRTIVVYCADKQCSASPTAARKLEEAGFTNVIDFAGGMAEWKLAGLPVEQGAHAHRR